MSNFEDLQHQQQSAVTRSALARLKTSKQDFNKVVEALNAEINSELNGPGKVDPNKILPLIERKNEILSIKDDADSVFDRLNRVAPQLSPNARLNSEDKDEIYKIGLSGRYTQAEIAEQFGITQPAVSDIIRKYKL